MSNYELFLGDCPDVTRGMPDASVDLVVTSPPYWNQREYSSWPTYADYMASVGEWVGQVFRLVKPGRHVFWVIPDKLPWPPKENETGERLYMPVYADTERLASEAGFVCKFPIIWKKPHGTRKMFGSYPYPPTTIHTPMTERICVWRKPGKPDLSRKRDKYAYTKEQWVQWAQDVWEITPESNPHHPAVFPAEIPRRCLTLWSFVGDTVLDPFTGSGTTGVVCAELDRNFIGIEKDATYYEIAHSRIEAAHSQLRMF